MLLTKSRGQREGNKSVRLIILFNPQQLHSQLTPIQLNTIANGPILFAEYQQYEQ